MIKYTVSKDFPLFHSLQHFHHKEKIHYGGEEEDLDCVID